MYIYIKAVLWIFCLCIHEVILQETKVTDATERPVCDQNIRLRCTYTGPLACCTTQTRLWTRDGTEIMSGGVATPSDKYMEEINSGYFDLIILDTNETDFGKDYVCTYQFVSSVAFNLAEDQEKKLTCGFKKCGLSYCATVLKVIVVTTCLLYLFSFILSTVILPCKITGINGNQRVQWFYRSGNGPMLRYSEDRDLNLLGLEQQIIQRIKITGKEQDGEYNLEIKNLKKSDEGTYICKYGGETLKQVNLRILGITKMCAVKIGVLSIVVNIVISLAVLLPIGYFYYNHCICEIGKMYGISFGVGAVIAAVLVLKNVLDYHIYLNWDRVTKWFHNRHCKCFLVFIETICCRKLWMKWNGKDKKEDTTSVPLKDKDGANDPEKGDK